MYLEEFEKQAEILKCLAHPRRLEIVHLLRDQELAVSDIHLMLDLPQANTSQHLMLMREAGIVTARRDGKQIYYSLTNQAIIEASDLIRQMVLIPAMSDRLTLKDLVPLAHDPVCGMRLSPKTASFHAHHQGSDFHFCASKCYRLFVENPEAYAK